MLSLQNIGPSVNDAPLFDWRKYLRIHPAAELFPLMKDTDPAGFNDHVEDIRAHGLAEPIVGWASNEGVFVFDGRNRLDALAQLGLLYETDDHHVGIKKWTGSEWSDRFGARIDGYEGAFRIIYERDGLDPYELVLSLNVHRRHFTPKLKRELIVNVLKAKPELSDRAIGRLTGSDHKTVGDIRSNGEIPHKPTDEANSNIPTDRVEASGRKARGRKPVAKPARKTKPARKIIKKAPPATTHLELFAGWNAASPTERTKTIDSIGLEALLDAIPQPWLPQLARRLAERGAPSPPAAAGNSPRDDLDLRGTFLDHRPPPAPEPAIPTPPKTKSSPVLHRDPFKGDWRKLSLPELELRIETIRTLAGKGHHFDDAQWKQLDRMRERADALRQTDRAVEVAINKPIESRVAS